MKRKPIILQDIWKTNIIEAINLLHDYIDITKYGFGSPSEMMNEFIDDCIGYLEDDFYYDNELPSVDWKYFVLNKAQDVGILNLNKIMEYLPDCMEE